VISRIDGVDAGVRPVGPGRKAITAAGGFGGLVFGFGLVFLFGNPPTPATITSHDNSETEVNVQQPTRRTCSNGNSTHKSNGKQSCRENQDSGMFHGMTLDEAIRSVERHGRE
jgi:hypothetical protein